jgi:hypothetical protein
MAITRITKAYRVKIAADGTGQVQAYPNGGTWIITNEAVSVSSQVLQPVAKMYLGQVADSNFIGGSYSGANDSNADQILMQPGTGLFCVWTGADVGAFATLTLTGTQYSPPDQAPPV